MIRGDIEKCNIKTICGGKIFKKLDKDTERELIKLAQQGDDNAKEKLIQHNMGFLTKSVMQYRGLGVDLDDLMSEAILGLIKSIEKFDLEANDYKLISYGSWWVRQKITAYLSGNARNLKLPAGKVKNYLAIKKMVAENNNVSSQEIAKELGVDDVEVDDLRRVYGGNLSLDEYVINGEDTTWVDRIKGKQDVEGDCFCKERDKNICEFLENLKTRKDVGIGDIERAVEIIKMRFGIGCEYPMTLEDIGEIYGITRERVRQIESKFFFVVEKVMTKEGFKEWLD